MIASEPDNLSADIPTTPFLFHLEHVFRAVLFWGQVKLKLDTSNVMSTVPVDRGIPVECRQGRFKHTVRGYIVHGYIEMGVAREYSLAQPALYRATAVGNSKVITVRSARTPS